MAFQAGRTPQCTIFRCYIHWSISSVIKLNAAIISKFITLTLVGLSAWILLVTKSLMLNQYLATSNNTPSLRMWCNAFKFPANSQHYRYTSCLPLLYKETACSGLRLSYLLVLHCSKGQIFFSFEVANWVPYTWKGIPSLSFIVPEILHMCLHCHTRWDEVHLLCFSPNWEGLFSVITSWSGTLSFNGETNA